METANSNKDDEGWQISTSRKDRDRGHHVENDSQKEEGGSHHSRGYSRYGNASPASTAPAYNAAARRLRENRGPGGNNRDWRKPHEERREGDLEERGGEKPLERGERSERGGSSRGGYDRGRRAASYRERVGGEQEKEEDEEWQVQRSWRTKSRDDGKWRGSNVVGRGGHAHGDRVQERAHSYSERNPERASSNRSIRSPRDDNREIRRHENDEEVPDWFDEEVSSDIQFDFSASAMQFRDSLTSAGSGGSGSKSYSYQFNSTKQQPLLTEEERVLLDQRLFERFPPNKIPFRYSVGHFLAIRNLVHSRPSEEEMAGQEMLFSNEVIEPVMTDQQKLNDFDDALHSRNKYQPRPAEKESSKGRGRGRGRGGVDLRNTWDGQSRAKSPARSSSTPVRWQYEDTSGIIQGPFIPEEMQSWLVGGYFMPELKVKRFGETNFIRLDELLKINPRPFEADEKASLHSSDGGISSNKPFMSDTVPLVNYGGGATSSNSDSMASSLDSIGLATSLTTSVPASANAPSSAAVYNSANPISASVLDSSTGSLSSSGGAIPNMLPLNDVYSMNSNLHNLRAPFPVSSSPSNVDDYFLSSRFGISASSGSSITEMGMSSTEMQYSFVQAQRQQLHQPQSQQYYMHPTQQPHHPHLHMQMPQQPILQQQQISQQHHIHHHHHQQMLAQHYLAQQQQQQQPHDMMNPMAGMPMGQFGYGNYGAPIPIQEFAHQHHGPTSLDDLIHHRQGAIPIVPENSQVWDLDSLEKNLQTAANAEKHRTIANNTSNVAHPVHNISNIIPLTNAGSSIANLNVVVAPDLIEKEEDVNNDLTFGINAPNNDSDGFPTNLPSFFTTDVHGIPLDPIDASSEWQTTRKPRSSQTSHDSKHTKQPGTPVASNSQQPKQQKPENVITLNKSSGSLASSSGGSGQQPPVNLRASLSRPAPWAQPSGRTKSLVEIQKEEEEERERERELEREREIEREKERLEREGEKSNLNWVEAIGGGAVSGNLPFSSIQAEEEKQKQKKLEREKDETTQKQHQQQLQQQKQKPQEKPEPPSTPLSFAEVQKQEMAFKKEADKKKKRNNKANAATADQALQGQAVAPVLSGAWANTQRTKSLQEIMLEEAEKAAQEKEREKERERERRAAEKQAQAAAAASSSPWRQPEPKLSLREIQRQEEELAKQRPIYEAPKQPVALQKKGWNLVTESPKNIKEIQDQEIQGKKKTAQSSASVEQPAAPVSITAQMAWEGKTKQETKQGKQERGPKPARAPAVSSAWTSRPSNSYQAAEESNSIEEEEDDDSGFWETASTTNKVETTPPKKQQNVPKNPPIAEKGVRTNREFVTWCSKKLQSFTGLPNVPVAEYIAGLDNPGEINQIVADTCGNDSRAQNFASEICEKLNLSKKEKQAAAENRNAGPPKNAKPGAGGAPAGSPNTNAAGKRKGKKKMQKVDASVFLGFNSDKSGRELETE